MLGDGAAIGGCLVFEFGVRGEGVGVGAEGGLGTGLAGAE